MGFPYLRNPCFRNPCFRNSHCRNPCFRNSHLRNFSRIQAPLNQTPLRLSPKKVVDYSDSIARLENSHGPAIKVRLCTKSQQLSSRDFLVRGTPVLGRDKCSTIKYVTVAVPECQPGSFEWSKNRLLGWLESKSRAPWSQKPSIFLHYIQPNFEIFESVVLILATSHQMFCWDFFNVMGWPPFCNGIAGLLFEDRKVHLCSSDLWKSRLQIPKSEPRNFTKINVRTIVWCNGIFSITSTYLQELKLWWQISDGSLWLFFSLRDSSVWRCVFSLLHRDYWGNRRKKV